MHNSKNIPTRPSSLSIPNPDRPSSPSNSYFGGTIRTATLTPRTESEAPSNVPKLTGVKSFRIADELIKQCSETIEDIRKQLSELGDDPKRIDFEGELNNYEKEFKSISKTLRTTTIKHSETLEQRNINQALKSISDDLYKLQQSIPVDQNTCIHSHFQCEKIAESCDHALQYIEKMLTDHATNLELEEDSNTYQAINADFKKIFTEYSFSSRCKNIPETRHQAELRMGLENLHDRISSFEKQLQNKIENIHALNEIHL